VCDTFAFDFDYALMPDVMNAVKKAGLPVLKEIYGERGLLEVSIRQSEVTGVLLKIKSLIRKVSPEEAATLDWPSGLTVGKT
jgi:hypothetical protein